jgi:hypothetical protein
MNIIIIGVTIYLSELGAYFWHRYAAHGKLIPNMIEKSHDKHHTIIDDQAFEDFLYIGIIVFLYGILLAYLFYLDIILLSTLLSIYIPLLIISFWNLYIHSAYHIKNHWLNSYQWFKDDKRIHFQHHYDPSKNYGIATHFSDVIFETFDYGFLQGER